METGTERADNGIAEIARRNGGVIEYGAENVVLIGCEHIREMRGETDEVVRRTRSERAENAVLMAVRDGGFEPDWFVERWVEADGGLVACAVFDDAAKVGPFVEQLGKVAEKWGETGAKGECPVRIVRDAALQGEIARLFTEELRKRREDQMAKWRAVLADARACGDWDGRVLVGEFDAGAEIGGASAAREAFDRVRSAIEAASPDGDGVGISYSGYWDGSVARYAFCFADCERCEDAKEMLNEIGARFYDPIAEEPDVGVELEMAALVIADAQRRERERENMREIGVEIADAAAEGVAGAVSEKAMKDAIDAAKMVD